MKCLKASFEQFFADTLKEKLSLQDTIQPAAMAFGKQPGGPCNKKKKKVKDEKGRKKEKNNNN
ncbi:hypothetical protein RFI_02126 [Reticulomyxa filosa]|uniref:Uncharacterized protein n=1 Tax=Reticulomyxa filosa TaxID=46433 RepID=X6PA00_RETFI|nr:hypothetical protein RFI_02126 [Reticulomyxa filosa]|eukprot:ETO34948.1 hypothetical protein RFI_02126 [Reticulomyxa filosa]